MLGTCSSLSSNPALFFMEVHSFASLCMALCIQHSGCPVPHPHPRWPRLWVDPWLSQCFTLGMGVADL